MTGTCVRESSASEAAKRRKSKVATKRHKKHQ
jgi:hypothetical protein